MLIILSYPSNLIKQKLSMIFLQFSVMLWVIWNVMGWNGIDVMGYLFLCNFCRRINKDTPTFVPLKIVKITCRCITSGAHDQNIITQHFECLPCLNLRKWCSCLLKLKWAPWWDPKSCLRLSEKKRMSAHESGKVFKKISKDFDIENSAAQ